MQVKDFDSPTKIYAKKMLSTLISGFYLKLLVFYFFTVAPSVEAQLYEFMLQTFPSPGLSSF